jgi:hypothetical protein
MLQHGALSLSLSHALSLRSDKTEQQKDSARPPFSVPSLMDTMTAADGPGSSKRLDPHLDCSLHLKLGLLCHVNSHCCLGLGDTFYRF